jgi:hypothetical protein
MPEKKKDTLSPEIRAAEKEIDEAFKSNPIIALGYATAAWTVLSTAEDKFSAEIFGPHGITPQRFAAFNDSVLFLLRYVFTWLRSSCPEGGDIPVRYIPEQVLAADKLINAALDYKRFVTAFTLTSRGYQDLKIQGNKLITVGERTGDRRYEAYNRLYRSAEELSQGSEEGAGSRRALFDDMVARALKIKGERFFVNARPRLVRSASDYLRPMMKQHVMLPDDWQCSRYTLKDFRQMYAAVCALALIQHVAHLEAVDRHCPHNCFASGLLVAKKEELARDIASYTGLGIRKVQEVLYDLTLGSHGLQPHQTEPALQPLIDLDGRHYAIMPLLWLNLASERNWTVLMNRLPGEQKAYSGLVKYKEELMRRRIESGLSDSEYRTAHGKIPGHPELPDVDLAIISDAGKLCVMTELKWFIDPAEIDEIMNKSKEIEKGILQMRRLKVAFDEECRGLLRLLGINKEYRVATAVVSANWIGHGWVQDRDVPVIREEHLAAKLSAASDLSEVVRWLNERHYLPIEGVHYDLVEMTATSGRWRLRWYGTRSLVDGSFAPL